MAMSSLFSFVPCRSMYNLLQVCIKYAGKMLDGGIIGAIFNDNIQNDIMVFPPACIDAVLVEIHSVERLMGHRPVCETLFAVESHELGALREADLVIFIHEGRDIAPVQH